MPETEEERRIRKEAKRRKREKEKLGTVETPNKGRLLFSFLDQVKIDLR